MAKPKTFSFSNAFKFGFSSFFESFPLFFMVIMTMILPYVLGIFSLLVLIVKAGITHLGEKPIVIHQQLPDLSQIHTFAAKFSPKFFIWIFFIWIILELIRLGFELGFIKIGLTLYDKKKPVYQDLFSQFSLVWRTLAATILYIAMVIGGFILFIVPGIYLAIKFGFYQNVLVDENCGVIESLRRSSQIANGAIGHLFLFFLLWAFINALVGGMIISLLISIPVMHLTKIFVYRRLKEQK